MKINNIEIGRLMHHKPYKIDKNGMITIAPLIREEGRMYWQYQREDGIVIMVPEEIHKGE